MSYVNNLSPGNFTTTGAYATRIPNAPVLPTGPASGTIAVVGGATDGPMNLPVVLSTNGGTASLLSTFGPSTTVPNSLTREIISATPEATQFIGVRVGDGTQTNATIQIPDGTGFASDTLPLGGAFTVGSTLLATVTPVSGSAIAIPYTVQTSDVNLTGVAASLAAKINASPAVTGSNAFLSVAAATTMGTFPAVALQSLTQGTAQNAIAVAASGSGGVTLSAMTATLTGGAAPGTLAVLRSVNPGTNGNRGQARLDLLSGTPTTAPVFRLTLTPPAGSPATSYTIQGYASASSTAYSAAAFQANFTALVNGTVANKPASAYYTATAGSSTQAPLTGVVFTGAGGTDGTAGITSAVQQGTDNGAGLRTGMYALRGKRFGHLILAGCTDLSVAQNMQAFLNSNPGGGLAYVTVPPGVSASTTAVIAALNAANANGPRIIPCADWCNVNDATSGMVLQVSPMGAIAGVFAGTSPWVPVANKPYVGKQGILSTERTAALLVDPLGEGGVREAAGIQYLTYSYELRNASYLLVPHNKASDGSRITDTRMFDVAQDLVLGVLRQYVGENQGPVPATGADLDPTRAAIRASLTSAFAAYTNTQSPRIAALNVVNITTDAQRQQGFAIEQVSITTLSGIDFAIGAIQIGQNVTIAPAALS